MYVKYINLKKKQTQDWVLSIFCFVLFCRDVIDEKV